MIISQKNKISILASSMLIFLIKPSFSLELQKYEELKKNNRSASLFHINGVGQGYSWSNTIVKERYGKPFYCGPKNLALNAENYMTILDDEIDKRKKLRELDKETPVELLLFYGLVHSFPCSK